ncbi:MAG: sulfatase [Planctomycetes bacterium]|nr:sulfatase [Planctomycetota bacterium]
MFRTLLILTAAWTAAPASAADKPNIVFILADDMRWDMMGCAGNPIIKTPHIDGIAKDGVRFENMFVTTAICAASRASILTGLYERTHRYTFGTKPITAEHIRTSYPVSLRMAGYRTGFVGKFGVGVPKGAAKEMFDSFVPLDRTPYWKKQPDGTEKHLTDIEGERAIEFINASKASEPFCLSVSFNAPHAEDNDPKQYFWQKEVDDLYRDTKFTLPKTMTSEMFDSHPDFLKNTESRVRFKWRFDEAEKYQRMVAGYYRMISGVDLVVGRLRAALKEKGIAENTIIVFTADNGYFLGERGFADKWYIYEHSIRVPLLVFDPRASKELRGRVVSQMALNVDIAPTLLQLSGTPIPKEVQGHSLVPLLKGDAPKDWRTDFFYEHLFERKNIPKSEGVRNERYSYVRWFEQKPLVEELYDHVADFDEVKNLIADPKYAEVRDTLRKRTTELRDQYGGPYRPNPADPKK